MASMCLKSVGFRATAWTLTRISLSEMAGTGISLKSTPLEKDFPTLGLASLYQRRCRSDTRAFIISANEDSRKGGVMRTVRRRLSPCRLS